MEKASEWERGRDKERGRKGERQLGGMKGVMGEGVNEMKCFSAG